MDTVEHPWNMGNWSIFEQSLGRGENPAGEPGCDGVAGILPGGGGFDRVAMGWRRVRLWVRLWVRLDAIG